MKIKTFLLMAALAATATAAPANLPCDVSPVTETLLNQWQFSRDSVSWQTVAVPHDWAIAGPFDKKWDLQVVAIKENGEDVATEHSGRSGGLPWIGKGYYRRTIDVPAGAGHAELVFDGAMADAHVYVNGRYAGGWPYGYNAFTVDITPWLNRGTVTNEVVVSLENLEESNRWYPGAGIYRPVKLVVTPEATHLDTWGLQTITHLAPKPTLLVRHRLAPGFGKADDYTLSVTLVDDVTPADGAARRRPVTVDIKADYMGNFARTVDIDGYQLWSPGNPHLYRLVCRLMKGGKCVDRQECRIGLRTLAWGPEQGGFTVNGKPVKFKGVCLHHDLGPLGAAENRAAVLRQLTTMKAMGANAIRTSHNMPSTAMVELCDSLGLMVMAESFDGWKEPKVRNGYGRLWDEWWQRDITNLVTHHRNHPSVVMWSVGNEIPEQWKVEGAERYRALIALCHALDPTRPVTCGMDNPDGTLTCGFAQSADIAGFNYRVHRYPDNLLQLPQGQLLGSETCSTISTRGHYEFPDTFATNNTKRFVNGQCTSYDLECCWWSNLPDDDWAMQERLGDQVLGEFVWTGYDYLGEPTPYDEYWPSRSSYFGICDLAGLPKDRYWLYRSHWNKDDHTLHLLPHWTWPDRRGKVVPVYCYTDYPSAELFVNGKSQGRLTKDPSSRLDRYRLRWREVRYEPGELRVVAYDEQGRPAAEKVVRTAGKPKRLALEPDRATMAADGNDLIFVTVSLLDNNGTLCPDAADRLTFEVTGAGRFKGVCNGDPTSLEVFTQPAMRLFHGQLVVVVQSDRHAGPITLTVRDKQRGINGTVTLQAE